MKKIKSISDVTNLIDNIHADYQIERDDIVNIINNYLKVRDMFNSHTLEKSFKDSLDKLDILHESCNIYAMRVDIKNVIYKDVLDNLVFYDEDDNVSYILDYPTLENIYNVISDFKDKVDNYFNKYADDICDEYNDDYDRYFMDHQVYYEDFNAMLWIVRDKVKMDDVDKVDEVIGDMWSLHDYHLTDIID